MLLAAFPNPDWTRSGVRGDAADLFAIERVKRNPHVRANILAVMTQQQISKK
jgi:hypothetical protein